MGGTASCVRRLDAGSRPGFRFLPVDV